MKICNTCGKNKSEKEFNKRTDSPGGLTSICKPCNNQKSRQRAQLKRKQTNATHNAYVAKRRKNPIVVAIKRLRNRLLAALNQGLGSSSSCTTLFGKTKYDFEMYLHARHEFGMDAARGYGKHAPQPQFKPDPLTDDQRRHFCEQRSGIITNDHTVPITAFDLSIPLDNDGQELFQKKFKRFGSRPAPLPTPWQRICFSYLNTTRMWSIDNLKKGSIQEQSKEQLLEKYLRKNPYV